MSEIEPLNHAMKEKICQLEKENRDFEERIKQIEKERVEYLQNVSHQLVAPLNAIKWHIENLTTGPRIGVERAKKVLRSIYSQATIAVHLAKNFALMSNLEADISLSALKEPLQKIKLQRLMVNLADDFQPLAWDRDIRIIVLDEPLESAPEVLAIKPLISQVFSNIIENAVKYSNDSTEIKVDGFYRPSDDTVSVRIKNIGIRLNKEDLSHIFDRGFRSLEAKSKYPAGTGFGLYIARRIVEIHRGGISATTDETGCNTFTVTLSVRELEGETKRRG